jgi:MinD-like ATPase involved in chromosome partitioning or flagellar assembly
MVNQILNQFVSLCDWGKLDYLIIDMPPGTGDIQLTLAQIMNISAAVVVTTPQKLSFVDVVKGIDMFDTVNIPCVAVVENMAEYDKYSFDDDFYQSLADEVRQRLAGSDLQSISGSEAIQDILRKKVEGQRKPQRLFGMGHFQRLKEMWGYDENIGQLVSLPLEDEVSSAGDKGYPYVLQYPDSEIAKKMRGLANCVIAELEKGRVVGKTTFRYDKDCNTICVEGGKLFNDAVCVDPYDLRCNCRCATCVEELTGKRYINICGGYCFPNQYQYRSYLDCSGY